MHVNPLKHSPFPDPCTHKCYTCTNKYYTYTHKYYTCTHKLLHVPTHAHINATHAHISATHAHEKRKKKKCKKENRVGWRGVSAGKKEFHCSSSHPCPLLISGGTRHTRVHIDKYRRNTHACKLNVT